MKHSTAQHTARSVYASYGRARRPLCVLPRLLTASGHPVRCVCARVHNIILTILICVAFAQLATGGSAITAIEVLKEAGVAEVKHSTSAIYTIHMSFTHTHSHTEHGRSLLLPRECAKTDN